MKSKIKEIYENSMVALLWCLCYLFAILPRCVRYGVFAPFVSFVMHRVVHYRYDVIISQLHESFPAKSDAELKEICHRYYDHLAEMIIGTLSLAGMNDKKRAKATEFNLTNDFHEQIEGRNVVVLTSHYGFWEIALNLYLAIPKHRLIVAYRPIKSVIVDKLMRRLRNNPEVDVVPSQQLIRHYVANRNGINGKNLVVGLISDQNCPPTKGCCWHDFLRHDSLFFDGGEQLAKKFDYGVVYAHIISLKRGYYRVRFELITDNPSSMVENEITLSFARLLEANIQEQPERWLWTHNRWKWQRPIE